MLFAGDHRRYTGLACSWPGPWRCWWTPSFPTAPKQQFNPPHVPVRLAQRAAGPVIGLAVLGLLMKGGQDLLTWPRPCDQPGQLQRPDARPLRPLPPAAVPEPRLPPLAAPGRRHFPPEHRHLRCQAILGVFISTYVALFSLVFILWTLLSANVALTLIALSIAPPLMVTNVIFGRRLKRRTLEAREVETEFTTTVQRSISSVGLVQAFCREQEEYARFRSTVRKNIDAWWRLNWQEMFYWLIVGLIFGLGGAAVFGYGGYLVWRNMYVAPGCRRPDRGDLMVSCRTCPAVGPAVQDHRHRAQHPGGVAGAHASSRCSTASPPFRDEPGPGRCRSSPACWNCRTCRSPTARTPPCSAASTCGSSRPRWWPSSAQRRRQEHRAEPAAPLLRPHRGASLPGRPQHARREAGRPAAALALVLQDSVLLPTTIAENIAYGRPERRQARSPRRRTRRRGRLHRKPASWLSTRITEGGQNLSGGQRQRIAVAARC